MPDKICERCGGALRFTGKDTFSGREMREYECVKCGKTVSEDCGRALWEILSEGNEEDRKQALAAAAAAPPKPEKKPWWKFWR
jgi:DNA-directed RNA polymerase subunit RPC12/RpoP